MYLTSQMKFQLSLTICVVALVSRSQQSISSKTLTKSDSETVRSHPCIRRNNHIYCPFNGAQLASLHKASSANSSLSQGPSMYRRRFTVPKVLKSGSEHSPVLHTKLDTHVTYYTKQFDERTAHKHDLNDEAEHKFMHNGEHDVEHVLDDGVSIHKVKRHRMHDYIDDNKSMIRRMFGTHQTDGSSLLAEGGDLWHPESSMEHFSSFHENKSNGKSRRSKRTLRPSPLLGGNNKVDSCESSVEIVTPYWASNSAGKIRAIVNTQHLQQAIQQEVCQAVQTRHCNKNCSCEQKYKWHRLLAYDPDDDCKGIFMDWFLFPSCCVCRCSKF